ncbi:MAG: DNA polymerase III subunit gamma/tau [Coriobacteriales bacterium]|nr:DNA polymerase III subunit gamma/tau [Coriobacteriales bacterium]
MESLFRKYRPQTFESMVGQKHIVSTLQNALNEGRPAHAYLFSGPRGTGKTTTARLLAKALLCEHGPCASPDGTCEQCLEIAEGLHPDVYELDAASRTGVDSVREEIINRVDLAPTRGRKKVYIIDEVHMLTVAAFNALLKTIEEPPEHVVFVLCTTDPQKVPDTILSRCQRLEFHSITTQDIEERLQYVCEQEGFSYEPEALALIAKHAQGGLRDALSRLEQLSVYGSKQIRLADAQAVLGEVANDVLEGIAQAVASRDIARCFAAVADLVSRGSDITQLTRDFTAYIRDVYVASVAGAQAFTDRPDAGQLVLLAREMGGSDRLAFILDILGKLGMELRSSTDQRLSLEVALTRMARPEGDLTLEALAARIAQLETLVARLQQGGLPVQSHPAQAQPQPMAAQQQPQATPMQQPQVMPAQPQAAPVQQQVVSAQPQPVPVRPQPQPMPAPVQPQPVAAQPAPVVSPQVAPAQTPAPAANNLQQSQELWDRLVNEVTKAHASTGGLIRPMLGTLNNNVLTIENHGATFAAHMITRPQSMNVLQQAVARIYGPGISLVFTGSGFTDAPTKSAPAAKPSSAQPAPAQQAIPATTFKAAQPTQRPATQTPSIPAPVAVPQEPVVPQEPPQTSQTVNSPSEAARVSRPSEPQPQPQSQPKEPVDLPWTSPRKEPQVAEKPTETPPAVKAEQAQPPKQETPKKSSSSQGTSRSGKRKNPYPLPSVIAAKAAEARKQAEAGKAVNPIASAAPKKTAPKPKPVAQTPVTAPVKQEASAPISASVHAIPQSSGKPSPAQIPNPPSPEPPQYASKEDEVPLDLYDAYDESYDDIPPEDEPYNWSITGSNTNTTPSSDASAIHGLLSDAFGLGVKITKE